MRNSNLVLSIFLSNLFLTHGLSYDWNDHGFTDALVLEGGAGGLLNTSTDHDLPYLERHKRSVNGSEWDAAVIDLSSEMTVSSSGLPLGSTVEFTLRMDLPVVTSASPLSVQISGTNPDPDTATSSIHICSPEINEIVSSFNRSYELI